MNKLTFAQILKQERKKQQLTQLELAEKLNVSYKTVSSWENDRSYPDINMLKSISLVLNIAPDVLLEIENSNSDVHRANKQEENGQSLKEKQFINNTFLAIGLNSISLLNPIIHAVLSNIYNLSAGDGSLGRLPDYKGYEEIIKILFPIFAIIGVAGLIIGLIIFMKSSVIYIKEMNTGKNNKKSFYRLTFLYISSILIVIILNLLSFT